MVVKNFRARTARAGVAHLPEIVGAGDPDDAGFGEARDLLPEIERLVVIDVDGSGELVLRQAEFLRHQIPRQLDRAVLEIIAEREIAEHLEEGVMPRGVADIVEVVVLAAGAHAFLRGGGALIGPLLDAGEDVLELHHAGIGEHQGRVVARHQWRRRHDLVAFLREVVQKCRPDLVDAAHVHPIGNGPGQAANRLIFQRNAFRQGQSRCPETVQKDHRLAAPAQEPLIDAAAALTALARLCSAPICSRQSRRERSA